MEKQKLIDSFNKNSMELVKIHLEQFKGRLYADIRVWVLDKPGQNGAEKATHKGICISADLLSRLIEGLKKAEMELDRDSEKAEREAKRT